jgi:acyl carrier protein phosphodiesterase
MNHLAHAVLSPAQPALRLGNLFGDAVRGPLHAQELPADVLKGVAAHRRIDALTDGHPVTRALREDFPRPLRRYAGIILDVAFDHYLIRHWEAVCQRERRTFTLEVYALMTENAALLPPRVRPHAPRMIERDFLNRCASREGVMSVLAHLQGRLSRGFDLRQAEAALRTRDSALAQGFLEVFSDLQRASRSAV